MANSAIPKDSGAPANADYVLGTANANLPQAQPLGGLGTGFLFNNDDGTTGTLSIVGDSTVTPALETVTQANTFDVMDVIRRDGTAGEYVLAQGDSSANAEVVGMVVAASPTEFTVQQSGFVPASRGFFGFVDGEVSFLDPANPGGLTTTDPSTTGQVSRPVFLATDTDEGWILPYRGMIVGGGSAATTGGEWNLISENTLSGDASLTLNTIFSDNADYSEFEVRFEDFYSSATTNDISVRYIISSVAQTSGYDSVTDTFAPSGASSTTFIDLGADSTVHVQNSLSQSSQGFLKIYSPHTNGSQKLSGGTMYYGGTLGRKGSTVYSSARFHGSTAPIDGIMVYMDLGATMFGKIKIYGRA